MAANDPTSLQHLHDILEAAPVPWWPPAPGWYALGGLILLGLAWGLRRMVKRRRRNAYRRAALTQLQSLSARLNTGERRSADLRALAVLVKRTALAAWPRREIAAMSGRAWLDFLDHSGGTTDFNQGAGQMLEAVAYTSEGALHHLSDQEVAGLVSAIKRWIKTHGVRHA